jgi:thiamine biosynthesis lipoprotein
LACSRFREDSDLSRVNAAGGAWTPVSALLLQAVDVAIRAAEVTDGLVDPLLGSVMIRLGYDRDFGELPFDGEPVTPATWIWKRSWRDIELRHDRVDRGRTQSTLHRGNQILLGRYLLSESLCSA